MFEPYSPWLRSALSNEIYDSLYLYSKFYFFLYSKQFFRHAIRRLTYVFKLFPHDCVEMSAALLC